MYYTSSDLIRQFPYSDFSHCQKFIVSLERPGPALQPIYILLKVKAQPCSDVLTILTCSCSACIKKRKSEFLVLQIMKKGDIFLMFLNKHQSMEDWPVLADGQVQEVLEGLNGVNR